MGITVGHFFTLARGFSFTLASHSRKTPNLWISVYFCKILLMSDTIFSGRVQSRTGFFNQLYSAPFGSNFSEFFMIRNFLLVVDDFLDS